MPKSKSRFEIACRAHVAIAIVSLLLALVLSLPAQSLLTVLSETDVPFQTALDITFLAVMAWLYSPWQRKITVACLDSEGRILCILGPEVTKEEFLRRHRR